eukprot:TRINITY_DN67689_c12_g8_i1.p1 TRINITY_DN67689_c12_g8~~TRINITY_DN67689_c12_g8_i1.p1  ORF type:complete len:106 (-),score=11.91 TRINITY_DN67689_c12_g8_i1:265-582(-)
MDRRYHEKVQIKYGKGDKSVGTFTLRGETHTLGNILQTQLNCREDIQFAGYTVPHPLEDKMEIHLRGVEDTDAVELFQEGLSDTIQTMNKLEDAFDAALVEFNAA